MEPESITVSEAVFELHESSFLFTPLPNLLGGVDGFHANRFHGDYVDSVVVRSEDCAIAVRVRNEFDPGAPLREVDVLWCEVGTLEEVVIALRGLYHPSIYGSVDSWPNSGGLHYLNDGEAR